MTKIEEMEHGLESVTESVESVFKTIEQFNEPLKFINKNKKQFVKMFDKDGDGKIQLKELMNPEFFKWILIVLLSVGSTVLFNTFSNWLFNGIAEWGIPVTVMQYLIGPFIFGIMVKGTMDDYDKRIKKKTIEILDLEHLIQKERLTKINDDNKHEIAMTQLVNSLDLKNQEIEWLKVYGKIPIKP